MGDCVAQKSEGIVPVAEPPSAPQNLTVNFVDQSTVILSWNAPHMQGGRSDTTYRVVCDACSMGVKYIPNTVSFLQSHHMRVQEHAQF